MFLYLIFLTLLGLGCIGSLALPAMAIYVTEQNWLAELAARIQTVGTPTWTMVGFILLVLIMVFRPVASR